MRIHFDMATNGNQWQQHLTDLSGTFFGPNMLSIAVIQCHAMSSTLMHFDISMIFHDCSMQSMGYQKRSVTFCDTLRISWQSMAVLVPPFLPAILKWFAMLLTGFHMASIKWVVLRFQQQFKGGVQLKPRKTIL